MVTCICLSCARSLLSLLSELCKCSYMCSGWVNKDGLLTTRGNWSKNRLRRCHSSLIYGAPCSVRLCDKNVLVVCRSVEGIHADRLYMYGASCRDNHCELLIKKKLNGLASFGKHVLLNETNNRGDSYYPLIPELNQYFS
jgi:hypothetical protein